MCVCHSLSTEVCVWKDRACCKCENPRLLCVSPPPDTCVCVCVYVCVCKLHITVCVCVCVSMCVCVYLLNCT